MARSSEFLLLSVLFIKELLLSFAYTGLFGKVAVKSNYWHNKKLKVNL
jgi:hypothetical protein